MVGNFRVNRVIEYFRPIYIEMHNLNYPSFMNILVQVLYSLSRVTYWKMDWLECYGWEVMDHPPKFPILCSAIWNSCEIKASCHPLAIYTWEKLILCWDTSLHATVGKWWNASDYVWRKVSIKLSCSWHHIVCYLHCPYFAFMLRAWMTCTFILLHAVFWPAPHTCCHFQVVLFKQHYCNIKCKQMVKIPNQVMAFLNTCNVSWHRL